MKKITKAVFPVAGMGTRFLPATKASPKEMLPIVDKPLVQYAVEEAIEAGITEIIFVTGRNKRAIPDHFDTAYELESELEKKGKKELLNIVRNVLPVGVTCIYVRQSKALGLGHAVLCAKSVVGDNPFAVILADDLMDGEPGIMKQMVDIYSKKQCSIIGVEEVDKKDVSKYGIVEVGEGEEGLQRITGIIEKPSPENAPSNLGVIGRYILDSSIFDRLESTQPGTGGEIQLTDAIAELLKQDEVLAYRFDGKRYDCGSKIGYLQATVEYGLKHDELSAEFKAYLKEISKSLI